MGRMRLLARCLAAGVLWACAGATSTSGGAGGGSGATGAFESGGKSTLAGNAGTGGSAAGGHDVATAGMGSGKGGYSGSSGGSLGGGGRFDVTTGGRYEGVAGGSVVGWCPGEPVDPTNACSDDVACNAGLVCVSVAAARQVPVSPCMPYITQTELACTSRSSPGPSTLCPAPKSCLRGACGRLSCQPTCPDPIQCGAGYACEQGVCVLKRCDTPSGTTCEEGYRCDPANTTAASGCAPISCTEGYVCPAGSVCRPVTGEEHGCHVLTCAEGVPCPAGYDCTNMASPNDARCSLRACKHSTDCACGSCVQGYCDLVPGRCTVMGYGGS